MEIYRTIDSVTVGFLFRFSFLHAEVEMVVDYTTTDQVNLIGTFSKWLFLHWMKGKNTLCVCNFLTSQMERFNNNKTIYSLWNVKIKRKQLYIFRKNSNKLWLTTESILYSAFHWPFSTISTFCTLRALLLFVVFFFFQFSSAISSDFIRFLFCFLHFSSLSILFFNFCLRDFRQLKRTR